MILERILQSLVYDPKNPLIFNSSFFLFFFAVVMLFYPFVVKKIKVRTWYLMLASLYFYYKTSGVFVLLLVITAGINYLIGFGLENSKSQGRRRLLIALSVIWNLGSLGYYKYSNFLIDTINGLFGGNLPALDIFLPVGISFFTFQTMSYTLDIFYRKLKPVNSFADFLFFVSFFPQLVAGPILRASWFIPQINKQLSLNKEQVAKALLLIFTGLVKKGVIADYISINFVDRVFDNPALYSGLENLLALYGYSLQVYCDFSGYSDIAIGLATMMGFELQPNFNSPYRASSLGDFWRRWHISLSTWLRDYLYIPLGGSRKGKVRTYVNLMITMVLGGLWHGASFNFVIWGFLHGLALMVERSWNQIVCTRVPAMGWMGAALGTAVTFYWVNLAWIFFRAPTLEESLAMAKTYLIWDSAGTQSLPAITWPLIFGLGLLHIVSHRINLGAIIANIPANRFALTTGALAAVALAFVPLGYRPFIYFQF